MCHAVTRPTVTVRQRRVHKVCILEVFGVEHEQRHKCVGLLAVFTV